MTALTLVLLALPAQALGPASCRGLLEADLRSGTQSALSCFAPAATWSDSAGDAPAAQGFRGWLATRPRLPREGLREVRGAASVFLVGARTGGDRPRHLVLAVDPSPAGWTAARLYSASAPWPSAPAAKGSRDPRDLRAVLDGFNTRFGRGDVPGWLGYWRKDGVWDAALRRFSGPEVAVFFTRQGERYLAPRLETRDQTSPQTPGFVAEGTLAARCRDNGRPFAVRVLLVLHAAKGRISYGWEALLRGGDGCGPYWDGQPPPG